MVTGMTCRSLLTALPVCGLLVALAGDVAGQRGRRLQALTQTDEVKAAYAAVIEQANGSVVEILVDGESRVLGTVVAPGLVATKGSELQGGDEDDDERVVAVELHCSRGGQQWPCKQIGFDRVTDLALLSVPEADLPPIVWAAEVPAAGAFLASPDGSRLPVGIGVLAAAPYVHTKPRAFLGVQFAVGGSSSPAALAAVVDHGAAKAAGLRAGDVIVGFQDAVIDSQQALRDQLALRKPGDEATVTVRRDKVELQFDLELGSDIGGRRSLQEGIWGPLSRVRTGFKKILQHDTVLEPEDCGGPLVGLDGRAVGINIARAGRVETLALPRIEVEAVVAKIRAARR